MTDATEQDVEQLELYLDRELTPADAAAIDARLAVEPTLRAEMDRLRGQRSRRLAAMSFAFDNDSATVERLVASVRTAQASEVVERRRARTSWLRPALSAAACVAFGLTLGIVLHREHGSGAADTGGVSSIGGLTAFPMGSDNTAGQMNVGFESHGNYVVSVRDAQGREMMRVRFPTAQQAQRYIEQMNQRSNGVPNIDLSNAKVSEHTY